MREFLLTEAGRIRLEMALQPRPILPDRGMIR
jgi:hypothetical protein